MNTKRKELTPTGVEEDSLETDLDILDQARKGGIDPEFPGNHYKIQKKKQSGSFE